jgi:hypothetical protein
MKSIGWKHLFSLLLPLLLSSAGARSSRADIAAPPWYDAAWGYRMKITASSVMAQGGPFRDYSMVVRLGAVQNAVFQHSQSHGEDIVMTKGDGVTPLPVEMVMFDPQKPRAEFWFKADTLAASRRDFYLYYGNPVTARPPYDGSAWSSSYLGVYHLNDDPGLGVVFDSSPNQLNVHAGLEAQFTSSDTIQGAVGQAWRFNGTTNWIDGDGLASADSSFTISAWFACWNQFRPDDADFAFSVEEGFWHLSAKRNSDQRVPDALANNGTFTWPPSPIDTLLHQYTWCMDGEADTIRFYYDGVQQTPIIAYSPTGKRIYTGEHLGGNIGIGSPLFGNQNHFDLMEGIVDEFRVRVGIESSAFIASEYRNQKSNLFLTFGPEEPYGSVPVGLLAFQATWDGARASIEWQPAEPAEGGAFRLYRDMGNEGLLPVSSPLPALQVSYRVLDPSPPRGGADYRLEWTDRRGAVSWLGKTRLEPWSGHTLALKAVRPNPFRSSAAIQFSMDRGGDATLRVLDLLGRDVARPWSGWLEAGAHEIPWNGMDSRNEPLPAGVYLLRLETPWGTRAGKMIKAY